jgi:hypothetical protein
LNQLCSAKAKNKTCTPCDPQDWVWETLAYKEEVTALAEWCQENNLSLNVKNKMKELIVDFRRQQKEHAPIHTQWRR